MDQAPPLDSNPRTPGASPEQLGQAIAEIKQHIIRLDQTNHALRRAQLTTLGIIVLCFVVFLGSVYYQFQRFNDPAVQRMAVQQIEQTLPLVAKPVADAIIADAPIYLKAFQNEAKHQMPSLVHSVERESTNLLEHVRDRTRKQISDGLLTIVVPEYDRLVNQVPALKGEPKVKVLLLTSGLKEAVQITLVNLAVEQFGGSVKALEAINTSFQGFRQEVVAQREPQLELKLLATAFQLIGRRMADDIEARAPQGRAVR